MTLDASGNLGVGTTSPSGRLTVLRSLTGATDYTTEQVSVFNSATGATGNQATIGFHLGNSNWGPTATTARISAVLENGTTGATALAFGTAPDGSAATAPERARIDSSGNLLVGTTTLSNRLSVVAPSGQYVARFGLNGTGSQSFINFVIGEDTTPTGVGSITYNGSLTLYNTTSDQRLKENIVDAAPASALIDSLQVRQYDWKADGSHQRYGFVAQELVTVAPEAVHQPADPEEMMAVDYSKLVPMLVKEVQSLRARVAQLESKP